MVSFLGQTGADSPTQMDGSLILGGYDAAKTTGSSYTTSITYDQSCTLPLVITSIVMNWPNGTNTSILGMNQNDALRMCVTPANPIITLPENIWSLFQYYAGGNFLSHSQGLNFLGSSYDVKEVYASLNFTFVDCIDLTNYCSTHSYSGDLTFTVSSDLDIRIPNHQLVVPDVNFNDTTGNPVVNGFVREVLLSNLSKSINKDDLPSLGQIFLTSAYLNVDYDKNQFTIWQSNPNSNQEIVSQGPSQSCTTSSNSSNAAPDPNARPQTPTGTIVGGVVGGLAFWVLVLIFFLCFIRRKRAAVPVHQHYHQPPAPELGRKYNSLASEPNCHELGISVQP